MNAQDVVMQGTSMCCRKEEYAENGWKVEDGECVAMQHGCNRVVYRDDLCTKCHSGEYVLVYDENFCTSVDECQKNAHILEECVRVEDASEEEKNYDEESKLSDVSPVQ